MKGGESAIDKLRIIRNDFYLSGQIMLEHNKADIVIAQRLDHKLHCLWCHIIIRERAVAETIMMQTGWLEEKSFVAFTRLHVTLSEREVRKKLDELGF